MRKVIILTSLIFSASALCAQTKAEVMKQYNSRNQTAPSSTNYESVSGDPLNARIYTLENGMKVYLSVYKDAPRIQTYIAVRAGSKNDPADATGLAHYLEHMVFKGTDVFGTKDFKKENAEIQKIEQLYEVYRKTRDDAQRKKIYHQIDSVSGVAAKYAIANEYDKMLAAIGAVGTNAFTSNDQTVYVNDIPSNQTSNWLKIEAERFRKPVLRLFHTELEAVYEEKNRGLDSDDNKVWEKILEGLFKNHTYGTQTTIGTIEHLKNPSMTEINKYFNKYYVPNNMAIIMSGDFDPDIIIKEIEKNFGVYKSKPVESYTFQPEAAITKKIEYTVFGPNPESVNMAWRTNGKGSPEDEIVEVANSILYNGTAGLIDLNLNQSQKVLNAGTIYERMKDYGMLGITATPKEGQSLTQVEDLILGQVKLLASGNFPEWLLEAAKTDLIFQKTKLLESNQTRAFIMLNAFINDINWKQSVESINRIKSVTKQQIADYVSKNIKDNNYVVVYKKIGEDKSVIKVEKPSITPVELDRENMSPFVKNIIESKPTPIEPIFMDFTKDIQRKDIKQGLELLYTKNTENNLFNFKYYFDYGKNNDKATPIFVKYLNYISTENLKADEVKQEFYKLGSSLEIKSDVDKLEIKIDGLDENFEKTIQLLESIFTKPLVDQTTLNNLINDYKKEMADLKLDKRTILQNALTNYSRYGEKNPFNNNLSETALQSLKAEDIKNKIKQLLNINHKLLYYGPREFTGVYSILSKIHCVNNTLKEPIESETFKEQNCDGSVYVVDYDMKQVELNILTNGPAYSADLAPIVTLYNSYFGGNMSSVVFQELRESKALAYSCYSRFMQPKNLKTKYLNVSYIGSQADKLPEALKGMNDLLENMPKADVSFTTAKESVIAELRTQRVVKENKLNYYIASTKMGLNSDLRKVLFDKIPSFTYNDVSKFQASYIKGKTKNILVLGKKENKSFSELEKYGKVKFLTLGQIFGY
ncbi:MAG: insulinase family protein [Bacteroidetes bacterium]|nr:insulinase family protein [Bacteroidota bacterium]